MPSRQSLEALSKATDFIEDILPVFTEAYISLHLASCADCRTYVQQLALVRDSLHKLPGAEMADRTRQKLLQRLARVTRNTESD